MPTVMFVGAYRAMKTGKDGNAVAGVGGGGCGLADRGE